MTAPTTRTERDQGRLTSSTHEAELTSSEHLKRPKLTSRPTVDGVRTG